MSEALIFALTNPQYYKRLFMKIANCKLRTSGERVVYKPKLFFAYCFDIQNNFCTRHFLLMLLLLLIRSIFRIFVC